MPDIVNVFELEMALLKFNGDRAMARKYVAWKHAWRPTWRDHWLKVCLIFRMARRGGENKELT